MKAIIIGSGIAGLTAAAALTHEGFEVTVFEQHHRPGGVAATIEKDGFQWDLGQLMLEGFGKDEPIGEILLELGIHDQVSSRIDQRGYVFPDYEIRTPEEYGGPQWRMDYLKKEFPEDAGGLDKYWKDYLRFTRLMTLGRKAEKASGFAKTLIMARLYLTLLPLLPKAKWSAEKLMNYYFRSEKLQMVFTSILADFFITPSDFLGLGIFALNSELSFDKRIPKSLGPDTDQLYLYSMLGGIKNLTGPMVRLIESSGGTISVESPVEKIVVENNRVTGVQVGGEIHSADVVLASGDAEQIFFTLVGREKLTDDFACLVENQALMDSVFMVHLGIEMDPAPYVHGPVTYYYGTYDLEKGIKDARSGDFHEGRDGFVVHVPTLHSPVMAPEGRHSLTIYTICPDTLNEGSWESRKEEFADKLVAYTEKYIPGLKEKTLTREILTPADFRELTHAKHHAFGGLAPVMEKPRIKHQTPIEGLWFIGQQSESGGGVFNVLPSSWKVARRIVQMSK